MFFSFFLFEIALNGIGRICYLFFLSMRYFNFVLRPGLRRFINRIVWFAIRCRNFHSKWRSSFLFHRSCVNCFFFHFAVYIRIKRFTIAINVILHQCSQRFAKEPLRSIIIFRVRNLVMLLVLYYLLSVNILLSLDYLFLYKMISSTT